MQIGCSDLLTRFTECASMHIRQQYTVRDPGPSPGPGRALRRSDDQLYPAKLSAVLRIKIHWFCCQLLFNDTDTAETRRSRCRTVASHKFKESVNRRSAPSRKQ
eukprot:766605-Hanusia_phi.AAC.3